MMLLASGALSAPLLSSAAGAALAYVDPATTTSLFAILAPILAMLGIFLGFLVWPFRKALGALFHKKKGGEEATEAGPEAESKPEDE
ncbi:MAG TPA: hypothetical protein VNE39_22165 [Planctomycetota bacterium]|nr:hypothetical protein [Planctomycetota bacterium]